MPGMDTTDPSPWHVVADFFGVDLDDDEVLDALLSDPAAHIMWTSSEGVATAHALIATDTFGDAVTTVIEAAKAAAPNARVVRLVDPLTTIGDIAAEAGVTRQAVRNWSLGIRQSGFPRPLDVIGDGVRVWRRADVDRWLHEALNLGSGHRFPSARVVAALNESIAGENDPSTDVESVVHLEDEDGEGWIDAYVLAETQSEKIDRGPSSSTRSARATEVMRR